MERNLEIMKRLFLTLPLADVEGPDHLERADWMVRQALRRGWSLRTASASWRRGSRRRRRRGANATDHRAGVLRGSGFWGLKSAYAG